MIIRTLNKLSTLTHLSKRSFGSQIPPEKFEVIKKHKLHTEYAVPFVTFRISIPPRRLM